MLWYPYFFYSVTVLLILFRDYIYKHKEHSLNCCQSLIFHIVFLMQKLLGGRLTIGWQKGVTTSQ